MTSKLPNKSFETCISIDLRNVLLFLKERRWRWRSRVWSCVHHLPHVSQIALQPLPLPQLPHHIHRSIEAPSRILEINMRKFAARLPTDGACLYTMADCATLPSISIPRSLPFPFNNQKIIKLTLIRWNTFATSHSPAPPLGSHPTPAAYSSNSSPISGIPLAALLSSS